MNSSADSINAVMTELEKIKWLIKLSISPDSTDAVISELQSIKWLLAMLVVILFLFTVFIFVVLKKMQDKNGLIGRQLYNKNLQAELEELLVKGNAMAAKFSAREWIKDQPGEPYSHWFLAKAHYQLGEMIEAKKTFAHLLAMAPDWEKVITPWLERIESEISPKVVK